MSCIGASAEGSYGAVCTENDALQSGEKGMGGRNRDDRSCRVPGSGALLRGRGFARGRPVAGRRWGCARSSPRSPRRRRAAGGPAAPIPRQSPARNMPIRPGRCVRRRIAVPGRGGATRVRPAGWAISRAAAGRVVGSAPTACHPDRFQCRREAVDRLPGPSAVETSEEAGRLGSGVENQPQQLRQIPHRLAQSAPQQTRHLLQYISSAVGRLPGAWLASCLPGAGPPACLPGAGPPACLPGADRPCDPPPSDLPGADRPCDRPASRFDGVPWCPKRNPAAKAVHLRRLVRATYLLHSA